ncbi:MAG TPA: hypothetical protein VLF79_04305 [Candidatus Saccharimonadales bacterium]|nr:hypothetical protein [Candidatus Saccharimonadales bacterium]
MGSKGILTRWLSSCLAVGLLTVCGVSSANAIEVNGASSLPNVRGIEVAASRLPSAETKQQAEANQAALAPMVRSAIAAGNAKALLESNENPDVAYDLLRYGNLRSGDVGSPNNGQNAPAFVGPKRSIVAASAAQRKVKAHTAGCYGSPWNEHYWTEAGATVAWVYVRENGWCGSSGRITWYGGASFASWRWGPFCLGNHGSNYSWDYYPSWIHMANWATLGVTYPWGCFTYLSGGKAVVRIAWSGYWDSFNDYGF